MSTQIAIVFDNAIRDMLDEWVLTLCIVLSIAAIACPLLILFGLKQGVVQSVRDEFIRDPTYREIRPRETREYAPEFFASIDRDDRVELVVPDITRSASSLQIETADGVRSRTTDAHATIPGDPLLMLNGAAVPGRGQVVVSASLAEEFELAVGDELTLLVGRRHEGRSQNAAEPVQVVAVLDPRADAKNGLYLPLPLIVDIESFRFGRDVERDGWPAGVTPRTREVFDEVFVGCETELPPDVMARASVRTEFKMHRTLPGEQVVSLFPGMRANALAWHAFRATGGPTGERQVNALGSELRGLGCMHLLRRVDERLATMKGRVDEGAAALKGRKDERSSTLKNATEITLIGLSLEKRDEPLFDSGFEFAPGRAFPATLRGVASVDSGFSADQALRLSVTVGSVTLELPVIIERLSSTVPTGKLLVPVELLARLRIGDDTPIALDEASGEVVIGKLAYSGFRTYARSIDDVPALAGHISRLGDVEVIAKADEIVRARSLDQGLSKIVWIVASVGLIGGAGALAASLIASVERKKAEMGIYRLLGFSGVSVALFPVVQGVLIALIAVMIAGVLYLVFGQVVNDVLNMSDAGGDGLGIVRISMMQFSAFAGALGLLAMLCASVAARRSLRIEPAEALRAE